MLKLGGYMESKIRIAIIDSGIDLEHPLFSGDHIMTLNIDGSSNADDMVGHGTAIYSILRKALPLDRVEFYCLKIEWTEYGIDIDSIIQAIDILIQDVHVDIVNMSFGINISDKLDELYKKSKILAESGTIIVSAFDNYGAISYPAAFEHVIGVVSSNRCHKITDYEFFDDEFINLAAKGGIQRVAWNNHKYVTASGNSFACAHVTAQIAQLMLKGVCRKDHILNKLRDQAIMVHSFGEVSTSNTEKMFAIKKAILFPFNKEMHSLIRYYEMLDFEIDGIYDTKYTGTVGATTTHLLKDKRLKDILVENVSEINWSNDFDTLILGHTDELSNLTFQVDIKQKILSDALRYNKNIYSFDDIYDLFDKQYQNKIFCPRVLNSNVPPNRLGKLHRISKPILGVFGTSSKQGKFTLQLELRKLLSADGYKIGQIGTEPNALLFGMDYVFPMGYNASVYIQENDTIRYLNDLMHRLCTTSNDIIIVGAQSGTIPYDFGNISQMNIAQHLFLLGTQPDAVVLCVNAFDDYEYIKRTIKYIECCAECKVISIVVFPMTMTANWSNEYGAQIPLPSDTYATFKKNLSDYFKISVYKLGDKKDMINLKNDIISFFR